MEKNRVKVLQRKMLTRLRFPTLTDRHERIARAHQETFKWIFQKSDAADCQSTFANWLEQGQGILLVSGKPASGKSTLMKFIYDHHLTRKLLLKWVGDFQMPVLLAGYFFWKAGDSMQKSQAGLLQTLVYEILVQWPLLIPKVFPDRWEAYELLGDYYHLWTWWEIRTAFQIMIAETKGKAKLFLMVD